MQNSPFTLMTDPVFVRAAAGRLASLDLPRRTFRMGANIGHLTAIEQACYDEQADELDELEEPEKHASGE